MRHLCLTYNFSMQIDQHDLNYYNLNFNYYTVVNIHFNIFVNEQIIFSIEDK